MQLTTPETREYDTVFPGENWFFYWRTSPSLWESKLSGYQGPGPLFAPVFWGLHADGPENYDFGVRTPETDLAKLYQTANSLGKELIFLLPIAPAPFLPNGGLPSHLARTSSLNEEQMSLAALDSDGRMNKIFSFFDPRVFQAFRGFASALAGYMSEHAIACEIYGANSFYIESFRRKSFFQDRSGIFERGFNRYLSQLKEEGSLPSDLKDNPEKLESLKCGYAAQIEELYRQAAGECLAANWSGILNFGFAGASPDDLMARSWERWEKPGGFFKPLLESLTLDLLPSSVLLSPENKKEPLSKAFKDVTTESFIRSRLENELCEGEGGNGFQPLVFFELVSGPDSLASFERSGLLNYLDREYSWAYRILERFDFSQEEEWSSKTRFFSGANLDTSMFNNVLKLLMSGSNVFLDTAGMPEDLERKLTLFVIENDLSVEKLNYICPISKIKLGEGSIVTYESDKLFEAPVIKKLNFWDTLTSFLKIKRLSVQTDEQVTYFWSSRASNTYELNYEEIRRVNLYNTTSYKKKAHIVSAKSFAFLKTVDQKNVEVKSTPIGIDVQLLPGGSVSLDFGYYE